MYVNNISASHKFSAVSPIYGLLSVLFAFALAFAFAFAFAHRAQAHPALMAFAAAHAVSAHSVSVMSGTHFAAAHQFTAQSTFRSHSLLEVGQGLKSQSVFAHGFVSHSVYTAGTTTHLSGHGVILSHAYPHLHHSVYERCFDSRSADRTADNYLQHEHTWFQYTDSARYGHAYWGTCRRPEQCYEFAHIGLFQ